MCWYHVPWWQSSRPVRESDHSYPSNAEVEISGAMPPLLVFIMCTGTNLPIPFLDATKPEFISVTHQLGILIYMMLQ
jgi:hypothetical protein